MAVCPLIRIGKYGSRKTPTKCRAAIFFSAAEVFKGLVQIHLDKPLSFREKKMLDRSRHMLVSEISISRNVPEITATALLQRALNKTGLTLPAVL